MGPPAQSSEITKPGLTEPGGVQEGLMSDTPRLKALLSGLSSLSPSFPRPFSESGQAYKTAPSNKANLLNPRRLDHSPGI